MALSKKLQIIIGVVMAVITNNSINTQAYQLLKDVSEYAVKRDLLQKSYPAFESFTGEMYAGLMPAALLDTDTTDFSDYFFWLFLPEGDSSDDGETTVESFRNDTLLIWLNGGPGVSNYQYSTINVVCVSCKEMMKSHIPSH
jgi:carboxypeptidase C (cathepsin A)